MLERNGFGEAGGFCGFKIVILFLKSPKMSDDKCKQVRADIQIAAELNILGRNAVKYRGCVRVSALHF